MLGSAWSRTSHLLRLGRPWQRIPDEKTFESWQILSSFVVPASHVLTVTNTIVVVVVIIIVEVVACWRHGHLEILSSYRHTHTRSAQNTWSRRSPGAAAEPRGSPRTVISLSHTVRFGRDSRAVRFSSENVTLPLCRFGFHSSFSAHCSTNRERWTSTNCRSSSTDRGRIYDKSAIFA